MAKSNNTLSEFTDFLNEIGGRITDDTWHAMKIHLNGKLRFFLFFKGVHYIVWYNYKNIGIRIIFA